MKDKTWKMRWDIRFVYFLLGWVNELNGDRERGFAGPKVEATLRTGAQPIS